MTVEQSPAASTPPPAPGTSDPVERYRARLRRSRARYAAVIALALAVAAAWAALTLAGGEIAHTTAHPAAAPAPSIAPQAPAAAPRPLWRSADQTALGTAYWGGTVITFDRHAVRGRDGASGAITWSYTRTDRTVCQVIQDQGVTVAIFEHKGNCDEVTAVDSQTGARRWNRTLDKDGMPLNGHPSYVVTPYTIMLTTPTVIYAFDPSGGLDRWTFSHAGCSIQHAVLGSQGALISQSCSHPSCAGLTHCGPGTQLLLRDPTAGRSEDDKDKANPDQVKWDLLGDTAVPASADQLVSAVDPRSHDLVALDATKGAVLGRLPLRAPATGPIAATATARAELLWAGGVTYSIELTGTGVFWSAATTSAPVVTGRAGVAANPGEPDLMQSVLTVTTPDAVAQLNPGTGSVERRFPVAAPPAGSRAYPLGSGFLVAGPGTAVYR